jgi:exonuclease III
VDVRGGGIAVLYLEYLSARCVDIPTTSGFGALATKLMLQSAAITVVTVYRPSGAITHSFFSSLADILDKMLCNGQRSQYFILCGDFNCLGTATDELDSQLVDVLRRYHLRQHVHDATHESGHILNIIATPDDAVNLCCTLLYSQTFSVIITLSSVIYAFHAIDLLWFAVNIVTFAT